MNKFLINATIVSSVRTRVYFENLKKSEFLFYFLALDHSDQPTSTKAEVKTDTPKLISDVKWGRCDCASCAQTCQKAEKDGEEQRQVIYLSNFYMP